MQKLKVYFTLEKKMKEVTFGMKRSVKKAIAATLSEENISFPCSVNVTFCSSEYIRELNREYRQVDKSTDVLSFPLYERSEMEAAYEEEGIVELGDVVLNLERAAVQAQEVGNSFLREVCFLCVHSALHLLGYDHVRSEEDDKIQCEKQKIIMENLKV